MSIEMMTATVLATTLSDALVADGIEDKWGRNISRWLKDTARHIVLAQTPTGLKTPITEELGRALDSIPLTDLVDSDGIDAAKILIDHMPTLLTVIGETP